MFKQLFKLTFVTFIWKRYKKIIVSTALLFFYLWLVGRVHGDYLSYLELRENAPDPGLSFILKWAALLFGVFIYFIFHFIYPHKFIKKPTNISENDDVDDPFNSLRHSKKLRSKADIIIEENIKQQK